MTILARTAVALVAGAALLLGALTTAASAIAAPTVPPLPLPGSDDAPSLVQLCAATGDDTIDTLLDGVADTELVGALAPLIGLTVPTDQGRVLRAGVDIDDVREALNCPAAPTPSTTLTAPTETPSTSTPSSTAPSGSSNAAAGSESSDGLDPTADDGSTPDTSGAQVVEVPEGSASTGA